MVEWFWGCDASSILIQRYVASLCCDEKLKAVSGSTLPSAPHTTVAEVQFIAPARTMAVQGGSAVGHGSQNNKCSHTQQSNKSNRITLCPGLEILRLLKNCRGPKCTIVSIGTQCFWISALHQNS